MPGNADVCVTVCGDGLTATGAGETCDDGLASNNACAGSSGCAGCTVVYGFTCWASTQYTTTVCVEDCGTGCHYGAAYKECDDGNTVNGDGCNQYC